MGKFKKALSLILATILSLSLFACSEDGDKELVYNPLEYDIEQRVDGNLPVETVTDRITPRLAYNAENDYDEWKEEVRAKLIELLGIDNIAKNACPLDVKIESTEYVEANEWIGQAHKRIKFVFNSEYGSTVPCFLLIPDTGKASYPLAITLHGHSSQGYLSSTGQWIVGGSSEETIAYAKGRGAYAIQAVENGYAALAIEQRGMATRMSYIDELARDRLETDTVCDYSAFNSLLLGRTILGERVWEVSKAIDALSDSVLADEVSKIDLSDITLTGSSGGGTATFYAACYDERITLAAPNCGFCTYEHSLVYTNSKYTACICNYIPNAYTWFEMQDLACLIAPRKLAIISGVDDSGFPIEGVRIGYETIEKLFEIEGVKDNCSLTVGDYGHYWEETDVWSAIEALRNA